MPVNQQVVSALQKQDVPPDRECQIGSLTQILQGVVDFVTTVTSNSQIPGSPTGDSIAQQALQVANLALSTAQQALAAIPQTRSDTSIALPTGDSIIALSWATPLPDTNYAVIGTYIGSAANAAQYYNFRIIAGTQTVNGCQLKFENTPANFSFAYLVQQIRSS